MHDRKANHPEYSVWRAMIDRCRRPGNDAYARYGGRGIRVCDRWKSFEPFLSDMGPRPLGGTIERKDNDGDYEPRNCRWATRQEQASNTSRSVKFTLNGKTQTMSAWAREIGLTINTLIARRKAGLPDHLILAPRSRQQGVSHPGAKLNDMAVQALRSSAAGGTSFRRLASQFGITRHHVADIVKRKRWAHI